MNSKITLDNISSFVSYGTNEPRFKNKNQVMAFTNDGQQVSLSKRELQDLMSEAEKDKKKYAGKVRIIKELIAHLP
jgi:hypothetical protein